MQRGNDAAAERSQATQRPHDLECVPGQSHAADDFPQQPDERGVADVMRVDLLGPGLKFDIDGVDEIVAVEAVVALQVEDQEGPEGEPDGPAEVAQGQTREPGLPGNVSVYGIGDGVVHAGGKSSAPMPPSPPAGERAAVMQKT